MDNDQADRLEALLARIADKLDELTDEHITHFEEWRAKNSS